MDASHSFVTAVTMTAETVRESQTNKEVSVVGNTPPQSIPRSSSSSHDENEFTNVKDPRSIQLGQSSAPPAEQSPVRDLDLCSERSQQKSCAGSAAALKGMSTDITGIHVNLPEPMVTSSSHLGTSQVADVDPASTGLDSRTDCHIDSNVARTYKDGQTNEQGEVVTIVTPACRAGKK